MQNTYILALITMCMLLAYYSFGCKKTEPTAIIPQLSTPQYSKDTVNQGDSIKISVDFIDGDGDLGFSYTSSATCDLCRTDTSTSCLYHPTWSLFLLDSRDSCLEFFRMPYIESNPRNPELIGKIDIDKYNMCCKKSGTIACTSLGSTVYDSVSYYVILRDRAGNFSNSLKLPTIYVRCM